MQDTYRVALELVGLFMIVAGSVIWLRSQIRKTQHQELEKLVDTRGKRIDDLETRVTEQTREIAELKGQVKALMAVKAEVIAEAVVGPVVTGVVEAIQPFLAKENT